MEHEDSGKYRQLLVRTLHQCSVKFADVASTVIPVLIEFLSDQNELAATDVLVFVREATQRFEQLRPVIISKLLDTSPSIKSVKIRRSALWILSEYCTTRDDIQNVMTLIRQSLGELPIVDDEMKKAAGDEKDEDIQMMQGVVQKLVTADGTYASQSAFSAMLPAKKEHVRPPLRQCLMDGEFFVGAAMATMLTKLALRYVAQTSDKRKQNAFLAEAMLIMATIIHLGKSGLPTKPITDDDADRIATCIRVLADQSPLMYHVFNDMCRRSLAVMLSVKADEEKEFQKSREKKSVRVQADDPVSFLQLTSKNDFGTTENMFDLTLSQALGFSNKKESSITTSSKLNKVTQLTGFSDPVYAEAYVHVNQYDIVLDVLVVNQTNDTLQNLTVELATLGDLKLVEKPQPIVMSPHDFTNIKASVKVASTENGIIFGNIVYDTSGAASDRNSVVLNDIHIDIMDYIVPASCTDTEFRQMWAEFEWENKVAVNTNITDLHEYLDHIIQCTNMKCLTPEKALHGDCGFMAANLYARSIFGEDALANLSIERSSNQPDSTVTGHIRIRAKSQGMALSMGDKINLSQKKNRVEAAK